MEKLNNEDFDDIIISAAISRSENTEMGASYSFSTVNDVGIKLKKSVGDGHASYFVVATEQNVPAGINNDYNNNLKCVNNLGDLVGFIRRHRKKKTPFRYYALDILKKDLKLPFAELFLKEYKIYSSISELQWKDLLLSLSKDKKCDRSVYEYVLKPPLESGAGLRLFITGPPGSGKTHLLKQIAVSCAKENVYTPFFISLKEKGEDDTDFLSFLSKQAKKNIGSETDELEKWKVIIDKYAQSGNMLLIEGLSTLSRSNGLYQSFGQFITKYPEAHIIITCVEEHGWKYLGDFLSSISLKLTDFQRMDKMNCVEQFIQEVFRMLGQEFFGLPKRS